MGAVYGTGWLYTYGTNHGAPSQCMGSLGHRVGNRLRLLVSRGLEGEWDRRGTLLTAAVLWLPAHTLCKRLLCMQMKRTETPHCIRE